MCLNGTTLSNITGVCVNCNTINCFHCNFNETCAECDQTFFFFNNSCICPILTTLSNISGLCVSCNLSNCSYCNIDD